MIGNLSSDPGYPSDFPAVQGVEDPPAANGWYVPEHPRRPDYVNRALAPGFISPPDVTRIRGNVYLNFLDCMFIQSHCFIT
jgi:hypothetical protein